MKIFKYLAMLFGAFALITGFSSCNKDDKNECCSFTYTDEGDTYSIRACEDGTMSYTVNGKTTTYNWKEEVDMDYSWSEIRSYIIEEGGSCK